MNITSVSVNYKTAPLPVRERLAFTKKKQAEIIRGMRAFNVAQEVVLISTCNRTEFYFYGFQVLRFSKFMNTLTGEQWERFMPYLRIYEKDAAVRRLFFVCTGLDSMVLGEDQILGQVKEAHRIAMENGGTGAVLNTLFRQAITGAKRVKTDTMLSKSAVSVATLAVKKCNEAMDGDYTVLLMGAGGKLGQILLKDLLSYPRIRVMAAVRRHQSDIAYDLAGAETIDYHDRYRYLEEADCVICATASPHCVFASEKMSRAVVEDSHKLLIDLAVPKDIHITGKERFQYLDIDDFLALAAQNNRIKSREAQKAEIILEKYIKDFYQWCEKRMEIKKELAY